MNRKSQSAGPARHRARGVSLVELMVALVLGLLVVGVAIGIFMSNRQTFRATENLARVQENARTAFELMARDIREAAGNPCKNDARVVNVLTGATGGWATNLGWGTALRGYGPTEAFGDAAFGSAAGTRVSGTEAIQLLSGDDSVATVRAHNATGASFTLNRNDHGFQAGDLMLVCNSRVASIFQASSGTTGTTVNHATGGTAPGNATTQLGPCAACVPYAGYAPVLPPSSPESLSVMTRLHSTRWYIGNNGRGGNSLYQSRLISGAVQNQEVAEGIQDMRVTYLMTGDNEYRNAAAINGAVNGWARVIATRVELTLQGQERVDGNLTTRRLIHVASLRNRNA